MWFDSIFSRIYYFRAGLTANYWERTKSVRVVEVLPSGYGYYCWNLTSFARALDVFSVNFPLSLPSEAL